MRFGLLVSGWHDPSEDLAAQARAHIERAKVAADEGFSSIWLGEHFLAQPWPVFQAVPFLARMGPEVAVDQLGMVVVLPFRHPVAFAEELATLDVVLDGRLALCLTLGWRPSELAMFGVAKHERVGRLEEYTEAMHRLLTTDGPVDLDGQYLRLEAASMHARSIQQPRPPFWIGAGVPAAVRRAARIGDKWLGSLHTPAPRLAENIAAYRDECERLGRPRAPALFRHCYAGATREQAYDEAGPALLSYYRTLGRWGLFSEVLPGRELAGSIETAARDRAVIGSVDDCVAELSRYVEMGFEEIVVQIGLIGMRHDRVLDAIRRVGREVLPRLATGVPA